MDIDGPMKTLMAELGFQEDELRKESRLSDDLGIDSTELVEIIVAMEKRFDVSIDTTAEDGLVTLADLVAAVYAPRPVATQG